MNGCASTPPQVLQAHQKELEVINSLQKSHLAIVDAYFNQKMLSFESFFFKTYGPSYLKHWKINFKVVYGRNYNEDKDFETLYNDLVAEYLSEIVPIQDIRQQLYDSILQEYSFAIETHHAVNGWIKSLEKLDSAKINSIDRLLSAIDNSLSLNSIDEAVKSAKENIKRKVLGFQ